jgi:hypothetical protein
VNLSQQRFWSLVGGFVDGTPLAWTTERAVACHGRYTCRDRLIFNGFQCKCQSLTLSSYTEPLFTTPSEGSWGQCLTSSGDTGGNVCAHVHAATRRRTAALDGKTCILALPPENCLQPVGSAVGVLWDCTTLAGVHILTAACAQRCSGDKRNGIAHAPEALQRPA